MNPALLIVAFAAGSILLVIGVVGIVLAWFPLAPGLALVGVAFTVETLAVLALVRGRASAQRAPHSHRR